MSEQKWINCFTLLFEDESVNILWVFIVLDDLIMRDFIDSEIVTQSRLNNSFASQTRKVTGYI